MTTPSHIIELASAQEASTLPAASGISPLDAASWTLHKPSRHLVLIRQERCVARCSVWAGNTPRLEQIPTGVIGHYAASDAEAGVAVLQRAVSVLSGMGKNTLVGPMDGTTWGRYRFVTSRGAEQPFFLEPDNPEDWPRHFITAGFAPLAHYSSALNEDLSITDPRVPNAIARLNAEGVGIRNISLEKYEQELKAIHALSIQAFAGNFLYTPIEQQEFVAMYQPLRDLLRPELVLLAERGDQLLGFIFGMPDLLETRRGELPRTVIAKSLAVRPGRDGAGLGSVLIDLFQQAARQIGFTRVIHALMHESNRSTKIAGRFGRPMREYTLFSKVQS